MRLPLKDALVRWAGERGYRIAWGGPGVLAGIRREIEDRCDAGEIGPKVVENYLGRSGFLVGAALPRIGTVGVIAVPRPAHRVDFALDGGTLETIVPPTYVGYDDLARSVVDELAPLVSEAGHRVAAQYLPLKPLATRLGLATYGRNNITYIEGLGSYYQLTGFVSDGDFGPMSAPGSIGVSALSRWCEGCFACRKACPTKAIATDRFLLHAERCLTLWTELPDPWPEWLVPSFHHCLVGCLRCQEICPQNAGRFTLERAPERFSAEETEAILAGAGGEAIGAGARAKLAALGLAGYGAQIGRNLRALVARSRSSRRRTSSS